MTQPSSPERSSRSGPESIDAPEAVRLILTTVDSAQQAESIARRLVQERLAACVNVLPGCRSIYHWQGDIAQANEWLILIKTTVGLVGTLETRFKDVHPYELPEFVVVAPEQVAAAYSKWIIGETSR